MNKKAQQAAGRLYQVARSVQDDWVAKVFAILKISQDAPLAETLATYRKIQDKWLTVVEIVTAKELREKQITTIEGFLKKEVGDKLVCIYNVDKGVIGGIKIKIGDNVFDETLASKIRDLTVSDKR